MDAALVHKTVKESRYSYKEFCLHICELMDVEPTDKNKDRIYNLIAPKGTGAPSNEEKEAIEFWMQAHNDFILFAKVAYKARRIDGYIAKLKHYLNTRIFSKKDKDTLIEFFSSLKI